MELPHLGKNCFLRECNQLDFLPVKCDACSEIFCIRHYQYDNHNCEKAKNRNVQVPVCPLCSEPVVSTRNELPDIAVSQHIDQFCKFNDKLKNHSKPKSNLQSCSFKSCKQKDLIYLECKDCRSKFCIKHRHPSDHSCVGPSMASNLSDNWRSFKSSCSNNASSSFAMIKNKAHQTSKSGQAALNRIANSIASSSNSQRHRNSQCSPNQTVNNLQGNLSEQEALAIALNESKTINNRATTTESHVPDLALSQQQQEEDLALARAIHESQIEARRRNGQAGSTKDTCILG